MPIVKIHLFLRMKKKDTKYKYSENYTNKMKFCIWKAIEIFLKLNLLTDHLDGCTLTMCFTILLLKCDILKAIVF